MAPKGSRKNPYTWSEYNYMLSNNITWYGGWVRNGDNLVYHTQGIMTYSGPCSKSNPVPSDIYAEMAQTGIWLGGWVLFLTNTSEKRYVSPDGTEYDITLGNQNNPCPISIYDEMKSNEIWEGGWVVDTFGDLQYIQDFPVHLNNNGGCGCGCGCGCGSGSGSGSGCGSGSGSGSGGEQGTQQDWCPIRAGSAVVGTVLGGVGELSIRWSDGNTVGLCGLSSVTASININNSSYSLQETNLYTIWVDAYQMSINGYFTYTYKGDLYRYTINGGTITILSKYRL